MVQAVDEVAMHQFFSFPINCKNHIKLFYYTCNQLCNTRAQIFTK